MAPPQLQTRPLAAGIEALSHANDMVEAFKAFDSDNDGLITAEELGGIMGSLGYNPTPQEVKEMMRRWDADGDGLLGMEEFLEMNAGDLDLGDLAGVLRDAFAALGPEGEEAVTGEGLYELLSCMGNLSMGDCMDIVASMDGDGDGVVNVEDLRLIVDALL